MTAQSQQQKRRRRNLAVVCVAAALVGGGLLLVREWMAGRNSYRPADLPVISSAQLANTQIVPTLDTPLGESGNAIWCATFQVAWNRARDDVFGEPLRLAGAQPVADRLNTSPVTEAALPPGDWFAAAGRIEDGIVDTIRRGMAQNFPGVREPDFGAVIGFVSYGYLDTQARFTTPFVDLQNPIQFTGADGVAQPVSGFGVHEGTDSDLAARQATQVKVLFSQAIDESYVTQFRSFAVDLTADQAEQQLIVAVLPRPRSLRAALDDLASRIEKSAPKGEIEARLWDSDVLAIPNVAFNVLHEFAELQGTDKTIENEGEFRGLFIAEAVQSIRFRLDKSGAVVVSESYMAANAEPRNFTADRPFLVVMKRRTADEPYFVAWIENNELLE